MGGIVRHPIGGRAVRLLREADYDRVAAKRVPQMLPARVLAVHAGGRQMPMPRV